MIYFHLKSMTNFECELRYSKAGGKMESYVELTFMHNYLILCISLTLSCICTKRRFKTITFLQIPLLLTFFASFIFFEYSEYLMIAIEIFCFIQYFKYKIHTYVLFISFRLIFHFLYIILFFGSIKHHQFFIFDEISVMLSDLFLLFMYGVLLCKAKYKIQENDFVIPFILNQKKYIGYIDSGNLATYHQIPIIFVKDKIYQLLHGENILIEIENVNQSKWINGKQENIMIDHKSSRVICCLLENDFKYDALLNMKGIL